MLKDSNLLEFYTGFRSAARYTTFRNFVKKCWQSNYKISESNRGRPGKITFENKLFLFMCRIRAGLLEEDLAFRFHISVALVSEICTFFTFFLSKTFRQIPIWMSRKVVDDTMPEYIKTKYPKTRVILDTTHLYVEKSTDFETQAATWSNYKYHMTGAALIGISPNGFITFVGDVAPGRISDKDNTIQSGIIDLLEPGDSVMADRGFLIEDQLREKDVHLNIPSFLQGRPQL